MLQWGRTLSSAESREIVEERVIAWPALQWGRTLSSAESRPASGRLSRNGLASMGPHSFKCGKSCEVRRFASNFFGLQWGRTLSSAESLRFNEVSKDKQVGFNGAALFQVRKEGLTQKWKA